MPSKINTDEALKLYQNGMSDGEIAKHLCVTQSGVTRWRQRQGLPPNFAQQTRLDADKRRLARKLLREGMSAGQVAATIGCCYMTIQHIRRDIKQDPRLRGHGQTLRGVRHRTKRDAVAVLAELKAATRHVTDATIRDDVMGDMFLAMMEGKLSRDQIKTEARRYTGRAIDQWQSKWAPASIDEALTEDGLRLIDLIACPSAQAWLDSVGA
jgi:transposase